tara:strand:- start:106 stop:738 length:633 start_codon:yes stop_codon:yes gene_type:complete
MGFWSNLFKKKELPKPKSKKVGDKGYVRKPVTKPVVKKEPPKEEPPRQSFDSWESEMHQRYVEFDSDGLSDTWGNIWQKIAANELDGATLVNGKNPSDLLNDNPKVKDDLDIMLACCRAELQRADIGENTPAPFYFKRAAILFAKQKLFAKEIQICQLYLDSLKDYKKRRGVNLAGWTLTDDFYIRIQKAQIKLDKLKNKAIKKGPKNIP